MAGLICYNDGGVAQIDSEHRNLRFKDHGTLTQANIGVATLAYPSATLLAFASNKPVRAYYNGVGAARFTCINTFTTIDWWTFDVGTSAVFGSGIRIFNQAGEQVFDGADRLPKVVGFAQSLGGTYNTGAARVAVCMTPGTPQRIAGGNQSNVYVSCSGGTVTAQMLADGPGGGITFFANPCQLLMLDVAGL